MFCWFSCLFRYSNCHCNNYCNWISKILLNKQDVCHDVINCSQSCCMLYVFSSLFSCSKFHCNTNYNWISRMLLNKQHVWYDLVNYSHRGVCMVCQFSSLFSYSKYHSTTYCSYCNWISRICNTNTSFTANVCVRCVRFPAYTADVSSIVYRSLTEKAASLSLLRHLQLKTALSSFFLCTMNACVFADYAGNSASFFWWYGVDTVPRTAPTHIIDEQTQIHRISVQKIANPRRGLKLDNALCCSLNAYYLPCFKS